MSSNKELAEQHKALGNKAFQGGDHATAIAEFSKAIELDPTNHVLYSNRSASFASQKKFKEALDDANKAVELKPDWAKGYSRKGAAEFGLGNHMESIKAYEKGLEIDPNNAALQSGLADVQAALQQQSQAGLGAIFNEGVWAKLAANPTTAPFLQQPDFVEKLKMIIANPQMLNMHLQDQRIMSCMGALLGINMQTAGADEPFRPDPEEPKKKNPEPPKEPTPEPEPETEEEREAKRIKTEALTFKDKGNQLYKERKFEEAHAQYDKAIELDPDNMSFLNNKAAVFFEQQDYKECIKTCDKAIEVGRRVYADYKLIAKAYMRQGNAYVKLDDLEAAIKHFQKSLTEHRTPECLKRLNEIEKLKKQRDIEAYIDPAKSLEEKEKGNECFKKGDLPQAVKHYSEAIRRNPSDATLYSNRAASYTRLQAFSDALKDCEKCIELDPKFIKGYTRKATVYFFRKEYHKALEVYDQALKIDENNSEVTDGIARTVAAMEERNRAARSGQVDQESVKAAMADPEIQAILSDPHFKTILDQMQSDPAAAGTLMRDPTVAAKIQKLVAAGVIQVQ